MVFLGEIIIIMTSLEKPFLVYIEYLHLQSLYMYMYMYIPHTITLTYSHLYKITVQYLNALSLSQQKHS